MPFLPILSRKRGEQNLNGVSKRLSLFSILFIMLTFLFTNTAFGDPGATIYVDPASLTNPSSPFTVAINVSDVADLYAWECKLYYNKTILTISTVSIGPLLNNTVGTANTWATASQTDAWNATHGRIYAAQSILGDRQGANVTLPNDKTIASLSFTVDGPAGTTPLNLVQTKFVGYNYTGDKAIYRIAHTATDGSVTITGVPEFPMGLALEMALIVVVIYVWRRKKGGRTANSIQWESASPVKANQAKHILFKK